MADVGLPFFCLVLHRHVNGGKCRLSRQMLLGYFSFAMASQRSNESHRSVWREIVCQIHSQTGAEALRALPDASESDANKWYYMDHSHSQTHSSLTSKEFFAVNYSNLTPYSSASSPSVFDMFLFLAAAPAVIGHRQHRRKATTATVCRSARGTLLLPTMMCSLSTYCHRRKIKETDATIIMVCRCSASRDTSGDGQQRGMRSDPFQ